MVGRTYQQECSYIERLTNHSFRIKKGFVDNMKVCYLPRYPVLQIVLMENIKPMYVLITYLSSFMGMLYYLLSVDC